MQQQVWYIEPAVVVERLVECLLCQRHSLRLAFDDEEGEKPTPIPSLKGREISIDDCIAAKEFTFFPALKGREMKRHLYCDEGGGIAELLHQPVQQLLTHPLFGRQTHPAMTPLTEDLLFSVLKTSLQNRPLR